MLNKFPPIETTPEIERLIQERAPIAIGVSGGKDSSTLGIALTEYLNAREHPSNKRVLIHADLGEIEWEESLTWCRKLSEYTETPLIVVQRKAGGMIERWEARWEANWNRFANLDCLKLILPWSTPSMRFCTSELKTDIICRDLKNRFPNTRIISACGIRAEESPKRALSPITKEQPKLRSKTTTGTDWNPIKFWRIQDVFNLHKTCGFPLHPAYTQYGASRVSCTYCILSNTNDQLAALKKLENHNAYQRICKIELTSAFSFQANRWLSELHPELLENGRQRIQAAKLLATKRTQLENLLPKSLHYEKGKKHPPRPITCEEAQILHKSRSEIFSLYGKTFPMTPDDILKNLNSRITTHKEPAQFKLFNF